HCFLPSGTAVPISKPISKQHHKKKQAAKGKPMLNYLGFIRFTFPLLQLVCRTNHANELSLLNEEEQSFTLKKVPRH
ncbi:hypothetical protein, partial [Paenibacillus turpanensis]|uniref:hypothetical protein n=1 Tax=Paenibacillus turpanensis TaxID=2689078 RepID=UPI001A9FB22E